MRQRSDPTELRFGEKIWHVSWGLLLLILMVCAIGFIMLYSAAGGSLEPWASRQMLRFGVGLVILIAVALTDLRFWLRWAYAFYTASLILLVAVEIMGEIGMGAQRWLDLGFIQIQPSELMKMAVIMALARYFHGLAAEDIGRLGVLVTPLLFVLMPVALVMRQPDLGTAILILLSGGAVFFMAGVRMWKFAVVLTTSISLIPVAWQFLRDYQKQRVLIFFDPESDPLGSGYHITQSKIALGSGGVFGKGYMLGSQSHLNFLPEKHTDFIFTMLAEEFGLMGGLGLLALYALILAYGYAIALNCRNHFGRLLALGVNTIFFLYFFINIAMVMGLIPVVGVPLPLVSYGGTSLLSLLFGIGLILSVSVHRDLRIGRRYAHQAE